MKKIYILFILSIKLISAQENDKTQYMYDHLEANLRMSHTILKEHTKNSKIIKTNDFKNKTIKSFYYYNEKGLLSKIETPNNKKLIETRIKYDSLNLKKNIHFIKKRKSYTLKYERLSPSKILSYSKVNDKGIILLKKIWEYNSDSILIATKHFKNEKLYRRREYVYKTGSKNKLSRTNLYNKNGKVLKSWSFEYLGKGIEIKKKEISICNWESYDKNFLTKTYQNLDNKGKTTKRVNTYNAKDTTIVKIEFYNNKGILYMLFTYDKSYSKPLTQKRYSKTGKRLSFITYEYNDDLLILKSVVVGKKTYLTRFEYANYKPKRVEYSTIKKGIETKMRIITYFYS